MKIKEETTVSEEQVLFNKLNWEDKQFILKQMRMLQPCELSCEIEEEKKIPEKLSTWYSVEVTQSDEENVEYENYNFETMYEKINEICDYLKSKGE